MAAVMVNEMTTGRLETSQEMRQRILEAMDEIVDEAAASGLADALGTLQRFANLSKALEAQS